MELNYLMIGICVLVEIMCSIYFLYSIKAENITIKAYISIVIVMLISNYSLVEISLYDSFIFKEVSIVLMIITYIFILVYRENIKDISLVALFTCALLLINNLIVLEWSMLERPIQGKINLLIQSQLLKIAYVFFITKLLKKINYITDNTSIILLILCLVIKTITNLVVEVVIKGFYEVYKIIFLIFISIMLIYLLVVILTELYSRYIEKNRIQKYQVEKEESFEKYKQNIESIFDEIRAWDHDLKNHMTVMVSLLESKSEDELKKYVLHLDEEIHNIRRVVHTKNIVLDAILNSKTNKAYKKYINIDLDISIGEKLNISDLDLVILISNLLDNAIEACEYVEINRWIKVNIYSKKESLIVEVNNSTDNYKSLKTRKNSNTHGIGLMQIDNIVKKYNGYIKRKHENNVFETFLIIENIDKPDMI